MSRVVVAGAGLAGHEVVRRLLADPAFDGTITWHAGEPGHPYNRVLLTDLLAGRHAPSAIELPTLTDPRLIYRNTQLRSIAKADFDHLVIATGAEAVIPPVRGNTVALRTLADVRTILAELNADGNLDETARRDTRSRGEANQDTGSGIAQTDRPPLAGARGETNGETGSGATPTGGVPLFGGRARSGARGEATREAGSGSGMAQLGRSVLAGLGGRRHAATRRVAVVGGGPLGVETACALASRGIRVELLHRGPHVLSRWLDAESGALLAGSLAQAGITVHCDTDVSAITGGIWPTADLVILACGAQPRVGLARAAGLPVGRGILVDSSGRSLGDERIFAVGDCAQSVDRPSGALAALDDARRAAFSIVNGFSPLPAAPPPLRLRTYGIPGADVAVMGRPRPEASIQFTDQRRRTRKVLVLDGDVPVAAALVGDVGAAAALARAIARPTAPAPQSPAALLTSGAGRGAGGFDGT
ncbi:FAD-dependent pyridine nucleotide-disulphide oxidoreductase [Catenulispora acidiphila DSM 44928]|uniref:FAD-dependent pyridine nucleotide-disulphide oxidoreductase n=1 Tax=Catenulispora acidiphila (strain DSM 44928 / JCM 14897 / NBRC 102108 / NRRL B-24433 / ID139908) TaxID=479433 RepID=C7QIF3_CATAD|nr:FAD-dependent oxidoreductase [Catenulispora acidiphila]ACU75030.1 FAD-dependent pyridine nucleotide-disulphide oxidoreductase [Catenulispora acidiphila DSM 44928]